MKKLYRDPRNSILGGVVSGIAKYFNKDLTLIRLLFGFPILIFNSLPELIIFPIIIYWLMWIFVPLEKNRHNREFIQTSKSNSL